MKRALPIIVLILLLSLSLFACSNTPVESPQDSSPSEESDTEKAPEIDITKLSDEEYFGDDYYVPVLRFAVASDVHITSSHNQIEQARLAALFDVAYDYSASSSTYKNLDSVVFVGDFLNTGATEEIGTFTSIVNGKLKAETQPIYMYGSHEFKVDYAGFVERFTALTDSKETDHIVINGYHFIYLTPDKNMGNNFSDDLVAWLDGELAKATAESPTKPVFVFQHPHIQGTVYGSEDWGVTELTETLEKYPQVVDFSGYSHFPMIDPRSIYQDKFTALNTGGLSYYETDIEGYETSGVFPSGTNGGYTSSNASNDHAEFYLVEADKYGALRIKGYDLTSNRVIVSYNLRTPADTSSYSYTNERYLTSETPYFAEDAKITITNHTNTSFTYSFPAAYCKDNVQSYRVDFYQNKLKIARESILSDTFYYPAPISFERTYTPDDFSTTLTVKVTAVSSFGKYSEPLIIEVQPKSQVSLEKSCILDVAFTENGAINSLSGNALRQIGTPASVWNESNNCYEGVFTGSNAYVFDSIEDYYTELSTSISIEFYGKVTKLNNGLSCFDIISNQQAGGIGLEGKSDGSIFAYSKINDSTFVTSPSVKITGGEYFHAVITYDGAELKLYLNGILASTTSAQGSISWPTNIAYRHLVIGGDSNKTYTAENCYIGTMLNAKIYTKAMSAGEVALAYSAIASK